MDLRCDGAERRWLHRYRESSGVLMAWEKRGGKEYYYFGVRSGTRVKKLYVGRGVHAEIAAELLAERKSERAAAARIRAIESARRHRTVALFATTNVIMEAALAGEGYYRHNRGKWRRKRVQK